MSDSKQSQLNKTPMKRQWSNTSSNGLEMQGMQREESIQQERHRVHGILMEPYVFVTEVQGKGVRNKLIDAFQIWLNVPEAILNEVKEIVSKLHNSSLLIDDIEDKSTMRRGRPVAHAIYGEASTINCANYIYFQSMDQCRKLKNKLALDCFLDEMLNLHRGQGLDIYWRDNIICPTIEDYEGMVLDKTGGLFRLSLHLMQAFSTNKNNYTDLANKMALFFQIRDDYINLTLADYMKLKDFCEDLTEGKFSFPIIHCILSRPNDHRLLSILKQRTESVAIKQHALAYMKNCGSFEYTLDRLQVLDTEIKQMIKDLGGNPMLEKIQEKLCKDLFIEENNNEDKVSDMNKDIKIKEGEKEQGKENTQ